MLHPDVMKRLGFLVVVLLAVAGCASHPAAAAAPPTTYPTAVNSQVYVPPPPKVTYEVEGVTTDARVTMKTPTGQAQDSVADMQITAGPGQRWTYDGFSSGDFLYVSVQGGDEYTSVTCRIKVGGRVVSENYASTAYGIATCEGTD